MKVKIGALATLMTIVGAFAGTAYLCASLALDIVVVLALCWGEPL